MKVLFVAMPFGALRPAIGVSLLKAELEDIGVGSDVVYLNMRFAERFGLEDYEYVAERAPSQSLAGDWVFAASLGGPRPAADEAYFRDFVERFQVYGPTSPAIGRLRRARALAEDFLGASLNDVDWAAYDVIGFTSTFCQHAASLALAKRLKARFPQLIIVFGGANCEEAMGLQTHRAFPFVDFVCSGEADLSFPRLLQALGRGEDPAKIPGVVARRGDASVFASLAPARVRDLDDLPTPDYVDYYAQLPKTQTRATAGALLESSRGCWWGEKHHCTFCGLNGTSMTFRSKSAPRVLQEIDEISERFAPAYIEMVDNILDMAYFRTLLPELAARNRPLRFFYETKSNLTKQQVELLKTSGIETIQPGIESLSTSVLKLMRKGTSLVQNVQLLKWCKEMGVTVYWNLIFGFPGEEPDEYARIAGLIASLGHLTPPHSVGQIRLDRFSPNFRDAAAIGFANVRPDRSYFHIYDLPADDLANLAYFFEFDYADDRDPEAYLASTRRAVAKWHDQSDGRGLVYADHLTDLAIWDFRPGAAHTLVVLTDVERELYLYCDQHRAAHQVVEYAARRGIDAAAVSCLLQRLVDDRLMIFADGFYLSLAVSAPLKSTRPEVTLSTS